jgi:hypothetical protein
MITCKLTGSKGKPIKAHIIPKAFYELPPQEEGACKLLSNTPDTFPKKVPAGIYDSTLVTQEGEDIFDAWDNYAIQLLLDENMALEEISGNGRIVGWQLVNYDYSLLKLFSLSILWRAHASSHQAFKKVKLGSHEPIIRNLLLNNDAGSPDQYSVIISKWIDDGFGPVFMDPFSEKYDGVNFYRVYCGRYVFSIKVDSRLTSGSMRDMQLTSGRSLTLIARHLRNSKEWPIMQKIARESAR